VSFKVVIPARYASTRLPGKPLLDIGGKPMVIRVAEQANKSGADDVIIATDVEKIIQVAQAHAVAAVLTRVDHLSGTDRIAEVAQTLAWDDDDIVVNVQGDEPLIDPQLIQEVAITLANSNNAVMATACHAIHDEASMRNPNIVKVVMDTEGNALYFSRSPIPYPRDDIYKQHIKAYRHIGIYAYRVGFLKQYTDLKVTELEQIESLEQLRVLYHGYKIAVSITKNAPASGVDTQADLDAVRRIFLGSIQ
jgi:3-deoxy-manno-octulosonate cytidylyltransferase (CMP-KDO synthetase)